VLMKCEPADDARPAARAREQVEKMKALCTNLARNFNDSAENTPAGGSSILLPLPQWQHKALTAPVHGSLLSIVKEENIKLRRRKKKIFPDMQRVDTSIAHLNSQEKVNESNKSTLEEQLVVLENDWKDVKVKISSKEELIEELTTGIELEMNRQDAEEVCYKSLISCMIELCLPVKSVH
jgi:hypothetical protein